jgi:hypothetical protein
MFVAYLTKLANIQANGLFNYLEGKQREFSISNFEKYTGYVFIPP